MTQFAANIIQLHRSRPRLLWVLSLLAVLAGSVLADELVLREKTADPGLLVLNSGRVVHGELLPRPGGYDVMLPAGRMFVPSVQIRFTAESMDGAYQRMKDSITELTPSTHLELARWCLQNHLPQRARREVLDALHLDPYNDNARRMLEDLRREEQRVSLSVHRKTNVVESHPSSIDKVFADRRSLGGLPEELATTFTRRVQPLLQNKCGNSRCHSSGLNSFVVTPVRGASTAHIAERNLAAVLNQIRFDDPVNSPLLAATRGPHGRSNRLLFSGQTGRVQTELLKKWVLSVANELGASEQSVSHQSGEQDVAEPVVQTAQVKVAGSRAGDSGAALNSADRRFLTAADAATRPDEFDPRVFNRRYHGTRTSSEGSAVSPRNRGLGGQEDGK